MADLEVEGVRVLFGSLAAVDDVTLSVNMGERVGLIGPNGAGKTTLVNVIGGEIIPQGGSVRLAGQDITRAKPFQRFRGGLARTFQVAHPFPGLTVLDAVMVGPLSKGSSIREARTSALRAMDLLDIASLGERSMRELNPVSAKVVELCRIVASEATVVLLDELLTGLLPGERARVLEVLSGLSTSQRWATVMIEHLIAEIRGFCDRVVVLQEGVVLADGKTDEVLADPRVVEAYLGKQLPSRERSEAMRGPTTSVDG